MQKSPVPSPIGRLTHSRSLEQFAFSNSFSGQVLEESWTLTFYNVVFTVLPPFVLGIFDQFVAARMLDRYPELYKLGQQNKFVRRSGSCLQRGTVLTVVGVTVLDSHLLAVDRKRPVPFPRELSSYRDLPRDGADRHLCA